MWEGHPCRGSLVNLGFMGQWATSKHQIIAHKGNSSEFPENTKASVVSAIELGCDVIEIDVSTTKDGRSVAFHGPELDEMTSGRGKVSETNWDILKTLKVKSPHGNSSDERIPLVEELLTEHSHHTKWNLDLKAGLPNKNLVEKIKGLKIQEKVIFSGLTVRNVKKIIVDYPGINVLVNLSKIDRIVLRLRLLDKFYIRFRFRSFKNHPTVIGINTNYRFLTDRIIRNVHEIGLELWVFTVDEEKEMNSLFAAKVDSVTTNRPLAMMQARQ